MAGKSTSLIQSLAKKNIIDTSILVVVTLCIVWVINKEEDLTKMIMYVVGLLIAYFIFYQISRSNLIKTIDKLVDNELKEFQKISVKVLQLSEKQRQLTKRYMEMLNDVVQTTKLYKNSALK